MRKIIWSCWLQGQPEAPELVRKCLLSWQTQNPTWDIRFLDADTISRYIELDPYIDLTRQSIDASSLSDMISVMLLHEYGGIWVDPTTFCNVPLDEWLPLAANTGFFAFSHAAEDLPLASWFLAGQAGNSLLAKWVARSVQYWKGRKRSDDYFWLAHEFGELCAVDRRALRAWQNVPRISASAAYAIQEVGFYEEVDQVKSKIDWTIPVFKLTHQLDAERVNPTCLVSRLLGIGHGDLTDADATIGSVTALEPRAVTRPIGLLSVSTINLGDHIQIMAAENLLRRAGLVPTFHVDRDNDITRAPQVESEIAPGILMNGWFKWNPSEWPPHCAYLPLYLGFHAQLSEAPSLISPAALKHYATHGPVGCRDRHTVSVLRSHGIEAFLSHCLSMTFARRLPDPERQTEVFVVSHDERILEFLPASIGPHTFVWHLSDSYDSEENRRRAAELLRTYRERAKLVVTTLLHCALPVIAMGIPVVAFYPLDEGPKRKADLERFSTLSELVRVFWPSEAALVDWQGYTPDVSALKLKLVDRFFSMATRWGELAPSPLGPIAPPSTPPEFDIPHYFEAPQRLAALARTKSPDRHRWGAASSYKSEWAERGKMAARFIRDGSQVLEIGTGSGALRRLIADRCQYTGADLEPLDKSTLVLDLDNDPIPRGSWDTIVLLGVLEYLYYPARALRKIASAAGHVVLSYCCCVDDGSGSLDERRNCGWVNDMTERSISDEMSALGFHLSHRELFNSTPNFEQFVFEFTK